jgi:hypothetical protein
MAYLRWSLIRFCVLRRRNARSGLGHGTGTTWSGCATAMDLPLQEAAASPSVKSTRGRPSCTRGSLPRVQHSGKSSRGISLRERRLPREPKIVYSGKASPRAVQALGEELTPLVAAGVISFLFKKNLPRVQHSGKTPSSPRAAAQALGEDILFPESRSPGTRGRHPLPREPQPRHSGKPL